ncbi:MAG TPA: galactose oxidase-like domain-containing protein, partial [Roseiflexaceae bacterium]|nr:galactose oxidase-like domain-containing protein [Roseiflexaceae bacterium]
MTSVLLTLAAWLSLFVPLMGAATIATAADDPRAATGEWGAAINWNIFGKHMVLLPNGKVLAWPTGQDAFVWDPVTQQRTAVPALFGDLHCAAQTTLDDGRVLVAGGVIVSPHDGITVTAIFDPVTNLWTNATPMHYPRWYGTTTTLPDGRVLATSGDMPGGERANIPEIYDPAADTWTLMPNTAFKDLSLYPELFVLPNGKVYAAGAKTSTYILDTATGTWTNGPTNAFGSSGYAESSAMYAPGKIIRSGGGDPAFANTAIVDMTAASPQWKQVSPMTQPRRRHNMVILADGEVMAVGGTGSADDLSAAVYTGEIWNPATEQWTVTAPMTFDRMYHSAALLLPDGRVLTAGGEFNGRMNAQIFSPPYLFKGARPTITANPATVGYGAGFSISVSTDGSSISQVALIRPSAVTHAFDHNQRFVPLTFSQAGDTLSVTAPPNANYAPPGYYMLVVTDSKGVPSVAKFVRVNSLANLTPGTITGSVADSANDSPIAGATVSYSGGSTTTAADGSYTLANVSPGEVLVTFSKAGYATVSRTHTVNGGATSTLNMALAPPGTIAGKVTNSVTNEGIAGAIITYGGGTVTTNAAGDYTISGIPAGSQSLVASANGYNSSADQVVNVPANGTV